MKIFILLLPQLLAFVLPLEGIILMTVYISLMFIAFKALSLFEYPLPLADSLKYTMLWPGMNPREFVSQNNDKADFREGSISILIGILLILLSVTTENSLSIFFGFMSMFFVIHFGMLDILARFWQKAGRNVRLIINRPWKSVSLAEFWGRRWNTAFRDGVHKSLFIPMKNKFGSATAVFAVFLYSGVVHEAVISQPAGGGYGGPLIYFLVQFIGISVQKRVKILNRPVFTWAVILLPSSLLFHTDFFMNIVLPLINSTGG